MGSFANSVHVRSNAAAVVEAVRNVLRAEGYEPTDEAPAEDALWGGPTTLRAVQVSEARDGWVSLLDSDWMNGQTLAAALSGQLETHALQVMVNDSDSWHYQLHHGGQQLDSFDSSGEDDLEDENDSTDLAGMFAGADLADVRQNIMERARQMQDQITQMLPADLLAIQEQWKAGRASPEEMRKYAQWVNEQMPRLMGSLKGLFSGFSPASAQGRRSAEDQYFQPHVEHLRSLLKPGISDERVRGVLGARAVFAEETLGDFLPLLGISAFYAHLSYRYLGECSEKDLSSESIRIAEHLKFKKTGGGANNGLRIVH